MKAIVLTRDSRRHRFFAGQVARHYEAAGVLSEAHPNYYVTQRRESERIRQHFARIEAVEEQWFTDAGAAPAVRSVSSINDDEHIAWAREQNADVVCLFGTGILGQAWLDAFPSRIVNLHLGLSPFYRGTATLFWPFVNRELEFLGTTIHLAVAKVDAGPILERVDADLRPGEDYYTITNRLIRDSIARFPLAVRDYLDGRMVPHAQEPIAGKLYRKADFTEEALGRALDYVNGGLSPEEIARIGAARACRYSQ